MLGAGAAEARAEAADLSGAETAEMLGAQAAAANCAAAFPSTSAAFADELPSAPADPRRQGAANCVAERSTRRAAVALKNLS